jgi:hypothetical protein
LESIPLLYKERNMLTAICTSSFSPDPQQKPEDEKEDCAICYETYRFADQVIRAPGCGHKFHESCLMAWYEKSLTCPFCKSKTRQELIKKIRQMMSRQEGLAEH